MAKVYTRLLPVTGAIPKAGEDIKTPALWKESLRRGEVALFCFDATTGELLNLTGAAPESPMLESCTAVPSLFMARHLARGLLQKNPQMLYVLYNKDGQWLETITRTAVQRRSEGLHWARMLLQVPVLAAAGTLILIVGWRLLFASEPIKPWRELSLSTLALLVFIGLMVGVALKSIIQVIQISLWVWNTRSARAPMGSPAREKFYQALAKKPRLLTPIEITLQPVSISWPQPSLYEEWTGVLRQSGFEHFGGYLIPEVKIYEDFWLNSGEGFIAGIVHHPKRDMWMNTLTRYQDGSSFTVANKDETGLDPHPQKKIVYLGSQASAHDVLETARRQRPQAQRRVPTRENILEDYKKGWREYVEWSRARGRTPEELKRIDERRVARQKAASQTKA
jgi:hypothetical protein